MTEQTDAKDPTKALREKLAQKKDLVERVQMQSELDAMPQNMNEGILMQMQGTLARMLPSTLPPEKSAKLINNTIQLIRTTPLLARCGDTIMGGVLTSAQLGLELGVNALGEAYLLPFKKRRNVDGNWQDYYEAQLIIGYKGYRKLAWQSGVVREISRHIVWSKDEFDVRYGTDPGLHHKPFEEKDRGTVRGYYAVVSLINGGNLFTYMSLGEVEDHRDSYAMAKKKNYNTQELEIVGPWKDNFHEMALKTVLLKTLRDGPLSVEDKLGLAMNLDGSIRRFDPKNQAAIMPPTDLLNTAQLTEAFMANGVNVVDGETVDDPEDQDVQDAETEDEPAEKMPRKGTKAYRPAVLDRIRHLSLALEESPELIAQSITSVTHDTLDEYNDEELKTILDELNKTTPRN